MTCFFAHCTISESFNQLGDVCATLTVVQKGANQFARPAEDVGRGAIGDPIARTQQLAIDHRQTTGSE